MDRFQEMQVFQAVAEEQSFNRAARRLAGRTFLVGSESTIADVAANTYIAHAPEGNVSLERYPNVCAWLARIEALPGFVPMQRTAAGLERAA